MGVMRLRFVSCVDVDEIHDKSIRRVLGKRQNPVVLKRNLERPALEVLQFSRDERELLSIARIKRLDVVSGRCELLAGVIVSQQRRNGFGAVTGLRAPDPA